MDVHNLVVKGDPVIRNLLSLKLILSALAVAALGFGSVSEAKPKKDNKTPARKLAQVDPAEDEDAKPIIQAFKDRAAAGNIEDYEMMNSYLQRLLKIYVRTDALVKKFDEDLKKNIKDGKIDPQNYDDPMDSSNYRDIQVYYALHKRLVNRIVGFHHYLADIAEDDSIPNANAEKKAAISALESFHQALQGMSAAKKVAYQEIFLRIANNMAQALNERRLSRGQKPYTQAQMNRLTNKITSQVLQARAIVDLLNSEDYKNTMELEKQRADQSQAIEEMGGTLDKEFRDTRSSLAIGDSKQGRGPNASGIRPGTDDLGWVTGNGFTAGTWAFTYDDGPHASHTKTIMDVFNNHKIKATFFWLSKLTTIPSMKGVIDSVKASGHELANHSHTHANLPTLGASGLDQEIVTSQSLHTGVFGVAPKFFRCPYGACGNNTSEIRKRIYQQNMVMAFWNVDSLDWQDHNPQSVADRVKQQMAGRGKGIVLMHDIHASTAAATQILIPQLVQQGNVKFVTMSEGIQ